MNINTYKKHPPLSINDIVWRGILYNYYKNLQSVKTGLKKNRNTEHYQG
ncbi:MULTISPECIES: hypothetical protein [Nostocales]|uniref:Uncharacterized protein n=1 Tax=Dolichospermum heterosporum TAC447 TaxID=747523 RepID=A0ABY5LQ80_9CYAN|nr:MULTISPECIES: hypothetical protein [Nostocales]MCX5984415.1 hypothetical protein [Nostocales cyanobacterium LacPavin_0920_SED1_MAG_38_18]UUO14123.1 hypothetical protein NG743_19020 [Dolichospermum heterosporum TAC447]